MTDVARAAGVSHMTVSRVINDHPRVSPDTRQRVLAAMAELGYRPNIAARALVTGRTKTLGVVSLNTALFGPASLLVAIQTSARDSGYAVSVATVAEPDRRSFAGAVDYLRDHAVAGIVVIAPYVATGRGLLAPDDVPMVAVEGGPGRIPTVAVDQYLGATMAVRHLLDLGHTRIAHLAGPSDWFEARERERAWRDTLLAAGHPAQPVVRGDWSPRSGYQAANVLLRHDDVSAVFVANDQMAFGALRALLDAGVAVPEEMSVVGFDDVPEAEYCSPPLTTVRQDFDAVGRRALELLVEQVEGARRSRDRTVIPPEFLIRRSTAAPSTTREAHS
jgi:DNA-binding LacI/PurR family transcriptional regulator